ncbi:hypothetical protein M8C21_006283 [Ambrosia artemisiifolia]|uniref:Uncharacterized protein n=1 Tax=Ambrosia artemisiifolia TaxID=4212 RepID=A0AAD5CZP5_AMBAR|nr:hypothetical protein M8C21_006283 [Ambrosia artemisiifolia]
MPEKPLEGIQPTPSTTNFSVNFTDFLVQVRMFGVFLNRRNDQPLENTVNRYRKVDLSRNDIGYSQDVLATLLIALVGFGVYNRCNFLDNMDRSEPICIGRLWLQLHWTCLKKFKGVEECIAQ